MLSVSPPTQPSGFASLTSEERQVALAAMLVLQHDDDDVDWSGAHASPSSSSSSSSPSPLDRQSPASSRSSSPSPTLPSLLIRSKCQGWERSFELHSDWPVPALQHDDEVLIRHASIGLNPVDFKSVLYNFGIPNAPWVLGRDIAGVVTQVGAKVTGLRPGDRVWTCADSRDVRAGAYQAYSVSRAVHVGRVAAALQDEQAATLGTGLVTAAIAAYWFFRWPRAQSLGHGVAQPMPQSKPTASTPLQGKPWLLVYGGGAITGIFIAQLARLSGLQIVAVASPSNFDYLTSDEVGVTRCVDRYLSFDEQAKQVRDLTAPDGGVQFVVDCVGAKTATLCHDIAANSSSTLPAQMICLAGDPKSPTNNGTRDVAVHRISFSTTFYGDDVFAESVLSDLDALMHAGTLHAVRYEVVPDGLAGVRRGLERLRDNQAPRACKLVVNVAQTPHVHSTNLGVRTELGWNGQV